MANTTISILNQAEERLLKMPAITPESVTEVAQELAASISARTAFELLCECPNWMEQAPREERIIAEASIDGHQKVTVREVVDKLIWQLVEDYLEEKYNLR